MARRQHTRSGGHRYLITSLIVVGLVAGMGALAVGTGFPRRIFADSPVPTTVPTGTSHPKGGAGTTTTVPATTTTVPATTTTVPVRSDRPAGLTQAGDSKTICITGQPGSILNQAELATGYTYNCIETFTDTDKTWAQWVSPWIAYGGGAGFVSWVAADPTGHQLIDTQNLIPDDEAANPAWAAQCAAGEFNSYATQFAKTMVTAGFGYSVIRLGHEMNGNWETDSVGPTVAARRQWGQCFAQEVTAMRSVAGAHFLFDWSINAGYRDLPLAEFYPGDAYVDIVGISLYDQSGTPLPPVGSSQRWQALAGEPIGLDEVYAFAAQHHKPLGIGEWGTVSTQGDDANYVTHMADFITNHDLAYEAWFNADDFNIYPLKSSMDPLSVAAYVRTIVAGR